MRSTILAAVILLAACDGGLDERHVLPDALAADAGVVADAGPGDAGADAEQPRPWCIRVCEVGDWCVIARSACPADATAPAGCEAAEIAVVGAGPETVGPCAP